MKLQIENNDPEKPYLFKGESFIFPIPKKEGEFTIEAYSNIKQGLKSKSFRKIDVKHPQVTEAFWTYNDGGKKKTSGFAGENNHIKASIPGYVNQPVRIKFFLNDSKVVNYYNDTTTDGNGEINKILKFDTNLQKHFGIKNNKTAKIRFELEGIQNGNEPYLFKQNTNVYNEAILNVTTAAKITDAYFIYDGNRVNPFIQVPYGAKVTGVVKTLNMVGKEVKLKIYKDVHRAKHTAKAIVDSEGVTIINFTLDKKWKGITPLLGFGDVFYIGIDGVESKLYLQNGMSAVVANGTKPIKDKKEIFDEKNPQLIWGAKVSKEFRIRVVQICKNIEREKGTPFSPNVLMNIMAFETASSFSPKIGTFKDKPNDDREAGYVGLIQFGKVAAEHLKVKRSELLNMTALEQLAYVEKWFLLKTKDQLKTATDIYLSVNYPAASGKGHIDKEVVYGDPKAAYRANKPFLREADEIDKKGKKVGKKDGKTYVWEVREALEETAKEGEFARNIWRNPLDKMEIRGWYSTWRPNDSKFGKIPTRDAGKHEGIDLYAPVGTPVRACVDGLIVFNSTAGGYGNTVVLKGYYESKLYYFSYSHLKEKSKFIADKSWVKAGEIIAYTGKSGNAKDLTPEKTHLHFEVRPLKEWGDKTKDFRGRVDPTKEIKDLIVDLNPKKEEQI
ncbi:Murein hydrolase activator NlpD precursor [compost metagenome]